MTETASRIIQLMERKGDSAYSLERNAGLPISSIAQWRKGRNNPSMDSLIKLARYFNVSADYLLCLTDKPVPFDTPELAEIQNSVIFAELAQDQRFVNTAKVYKVLPDEYRERLYGVVQGIVIGLELDINKILGR